jgi:hypothetical protein
MSSLIDTHCSILDTGQIMDDLIPICRQEGGVYVWNTKYANCDMRCGMCDI